ncbi:oligo-glucosidase [Trichococcus patagoniensis]|uniref:Oligo-glucosidase n=1 Tax=Trichococcus patagoniensis TaxID=382641 RepID=A0A2T5IJZ2_9LACT|nr:alpha-glucosidase [Trichococcus patagoniensis]PTQ84137.1 oligo-glucosidase [Trichococcus patagoniensis]
MGNLEWWKTATVYQIYPKSFKDSNGDGIGDLPGITSRISYLKELGIDMVWLSPIYESPNVDNGYDISDYESIHPDYGTMADFDDLLAELHSNQIKVMMDLVVNHTSDEHHWFREACKAKDNPYRDYYIWRKGTNGQPPTDWSASFGGSSWTYDRTTDEYYLHQFSKSQPDLNWENPKLRQEIYQMMRFWLEKGVDGFRMDVINQISKKEVLGSYQEFELGQGWYKALKPDQASVHVWLNEMNREVLSHYDVVTVGETPKVTLEEALKYSNPLRSELHMVFQFEHMRLDRVKGKSKWDIAELPLVELKENLSKWQKALAGKGWNSLYWNNHDQPRIVSRFGNDEPKWRTLSAKLLAHTLYMMQGTTFLFQGEEIGLPNAYFDDIFDYNDIESVNYYQLKKQEGIPDQQIIRSLQAQSRDNGRTPVPWNNSHNFGFTTGKPWLPFSKHSDLPTAEDNVKDLESVYHYYRKLIRLRKEQAILSEGTYTLQLPENNQIFAFSRKYNEEEWFTYTNWSEETITIPMQPERRQRVIGNYGEAFYTNSREEELTLRPYEAITFRKE